MPFQLPKNEQQNDLLNEIISSLKSIQISIDSLNQRISNLESSNNDSNFHITSNLHSQLSDIINKLEQSNKKTTNHYSFSGLILLLIIIASIVFGFHFWDVPSQTNAINQYIYQKIITEQYSNQH